MKATGNNPANKWSVEHYGLLKAWLAVSLKAPVAARSAWPAPCIHLDQSIQQRWLMDRLTHWSTMLLLSGLKMEKAALMMSCCIISWRFVCCHSFLSGIFDASETVYRWRSRLCLLSPTWWFRLVRVPEDCQVQSPWWCQIVLQESTLSSAKLHRPTFTFFNLPA